VRLWITGGLSLIALAGCGSGTSARPPTKSAKAVPAGPSTLAIAAPRELRGAARATFVAGRMVAAEAGCLACHVIGTQGNSGPGPNLTNVGARLTSTDLARALRSPRAPMPSFAALPRRRFADLVRFLADLR
jgi:ubiquinol-cytochrome c reductase cytochrome b subunit/menaquinol-cytochrome c reductase cytochrome b/c subunit